MITYLLTHYFLENITVRYMVVSYRPHSIFFNVALIEIQYVLKLVGVLCFKIDCFPRALFRLRPYRSARHSLDVLPNSS